MECQSSDSKKLYKVFDGSKRKKSRKKDLEDANSIATDESVSACQVNPGHLSGKNSLQDLPTQALDGVPDGDNTRERSSNTSITRSPHEGHRSSRSPCRRRCSTREGISLALKAGMVSTPRDDDNLDNVPQDQDSFIYSFLEEAIKRDKKNKHRHSHSRRHRSRSNEPVDESPDRRHRHHRHHDVRPRDRDKQAKEGSPAPAIDQAALLENFAKICALMNEKTKESSKNTVTRTQSHKSLQCEVASCHDVHEERHAVRQSHERSHNDMTPTKIRSQESFQRQYAREKKIQDFSCHDTEPPTCCHGKATPKYASKMDVSRRREEDDRHRYREYPPVNVSTRTFLGQYRDRTPDYREYDRDRERRYEEYKRNYCEQKTSRSFDVHREHQEDERRRLTARSDTKDKRYDKYYDKSRDVAERSKVQSRRNLDRDCYPEPTREDEFKERERDRYSERERDSGMSVADGETSTISGRSTYMRAVKQEISEQREAMDKMMKLWKEMMRCFKGVSQTQPNKDQLVNESAESVRESAAAQLRLWRECMRRYETVARDVGDTDARLMEEINKQRSEMAEMASMWQECLQRYRDMSNDFNTLKQKLTKTESPTKLPAPPALVCAEGEGPAPATPYRMPPGGYPQMVPPFNGYPCPGGAGGGAVLRGRASAPPAPPAWWWGEQDTPRRRQSSPESRTSRDHDRDRDRDHDTRHRHKETRDESRYKGKPSKPSAARSEHRQRKR